jgi:hypothetical protein
MVDLRPELLYRPTIAMVLEDRTESSHSKIMQVYLPQSEVVWSRP